MRGKPLRRVFMHYRSWTPWWDRWGGRTDQGVIPSSDDFLHRDTPPPHDHCCSTSTCNLCFGTADAKASGKEGHQFSLLRMSGQMSALCSGFDIITEGRTCLTAETLRLIHKLSKKILFLKYVISPAEADEPRWIFWDGSAGGDERDQNLNISPVMMI